MAKPDPPKYIYIYICINIPKTMIMASSPITIWKIDVEKVETVETNFIFLGSKITVDGDCRH